MRSSGQSDIKSQEGLRSLSFTTLAKALENYRLKPMASIQAAEIVLGLTRDRPTVEKSPLALEATLENPRKDDTVGQVHRDVDLADPAEFRFGASLDYDKKRERSRKRSKAKRVRKK